MRLKAGGAARSRPHRPTDSSTADSSVAVRSQPVSVVRRSAARTWSRVATTGPSATT